MPERTRRAVVSTIVSLVVAALAAVIAAALDIGYAGAMFFLTFAILMTVLVLVPCLKDL